MKKLERMRKKTQVNQGFRVPDENLIRKFDDAQADPRDPTIHSRSITLSRKSCSLSKWYKYIPDMEPSISSIKVLLAIAQKI